jgi:hypothetical protein
VHIASHFAHTIRLYFNGLDHLHTGWIPVSYTR